MNPVPKLLAISCLFLCLLSLPLPEASAQDGPIRLNDKGNFETRGFNVLAFENAYTGFFFDEKTSGVMLIQHGVRTTMTDNLEYNPALSPYETDGCTSGTPDVRWAFTTRMAQNSYSSIAALAAAGRALKGYNDALATECLASAERAWAGNATIIRWSITNYLLRQAFPDLIRPEYTYRGMDYICGCHPYSNVSFVSGIGVHSKKIAYGNNRADYSFIAGGVVPGVLVIPPDFPENKDDWPFFWGENEYVIDINAEYLYLVHAVHALGGADR